MRVLKEFLGGDNEYTTERTSHLRAYLLLASNGAHGMIQNGGLTYENGTQYIRA